MAYWRCQCGAQNDAKTTTCEYCGVGSVAVVAASTAEWNAHRCARCGTLSQSTGPFYADTPCVEDRGVRLCGGCWIPALRRRAGQTSVDARCSESECRLTVRQHMAAIHLFLEEYAAGTIQARLRRQPTILERRGFHAPRPCVELSALEPHVRARYEPPRAEPAASEASA